MAITPKTITLDVSTTTEYDEVAALFFHSGWDAALKEAALQFSHGNIDNFFTEQNVTTKENN